MFLLWLRQLPGCGDQTPPSVPPPAEGRSSPTDTPVFPLVPSSYQVLCGSIYSFPTGQVLLAALSWCSACTSVSEGVFLMYPRREMYSMSIYSSIILFSKDTVLFDKDVSSGQGKCLFSFTTKALWAKNARVAASAGVCPLGCAEGKCRISCRTKSLGLLMLKKEKQTNKLSLLFHMLSRFVTVFLLRSKCFLISSL